MREAPSKYVRGRYAPGERSIKTCICSIQPVNNSKELEILPEGKSVEDVIKIYTLEDLIIAKKGTQNSSEIQQSDLIVWLDDAYEIVSKLPNFGGVINHFKYYATKLFPIPDVNLWVSGKIDRYYGQNL